MIVGDPQREGRQLHRYRGKIAALKRLLSDVRTVMQSVHASGATGKDIDAKTHTWLKKVDAALRGEVEDVMPPAALELRVEFLSMLAELEAGLLQPPKQGYSRRASHITLEDECDDGAEYVVVWDIEQVDIEMLRALLTHG